MIPAAFISSLKYSFHNKSHLLILLLISFQMVITDGIFNNKSFYSLRNYFECFVGIIIVFRASYSKLEN